MSGNPERERDNFPRPTSLSRHALAVLRAPAHRLRRRHVRRLRQRAEKHVVSVTGRRVAQGPFAGLRYHEQTSWDSSVPYLVGSYESELHDSLDQLISAAPTTIIDVGCAEGYYAIGLAQRLPAATIYAYDIDVKAQEICRDMAVMNGVADRVHVSGECRPDDLQSLCNKDALLIVDCEGFELELLRPDLVPALLDTAILVEMHDFIDASISGVLLSRFSGTHTAVIIDSGPKDLAEWRALDGLSRPAQQTAVDEHRPVAPYPMQWAILRPL